MRILILAPAFHPATGGAETYAKVVAAGLHARGHDVVVVTDGLRTSLPLSENLAGVTVHRFAGYGELLGDPAKLPWEQMSFALLPELEEVIDRHGPPDVILANSHEAAILGAMVSAQFSETALVATYHQQDRERGPLGVGRSRLVYGLLPIDGFLVGSRFYRDKALTFGAALQRVHHIPHGVDTALFTGRPQVRTDAKLRLLLAGRIAPRKQQRFMVDVVAGLRDAGIDAELTLAGEVHSSSREYADSVRQRITELGVDDHVRLVSGIKHDGMLSLYSGADILVQPSTEEGLGLAVLEAMACGVPVVVSDTVGLEEIVVSDSVGIKAPVDDRDAWVGHLAALARDEDRRLRISLGGQDRVRTSFAESVMLDATEKRLLTIHHDVAGRT